MAWFVPTVQALSAIGGLTTTVLSATRSDPSKKIASAAAKSEEERLQREFLASNRAEELRQKRASGSGQPTILGGSSGASSQPEIGRNVLLGQ